MRHKYHAQPTTVDGIRFASLKESRRYAELKLLEKAGVIRELEVQPKFPLLAAGSWGERVAIGKCILDFKYFDTRTARLVYEDTKGFDLPLSRWKRRHCEAQYGITVEVI